MNRTRGRGFLHPLPHLSLIARKLRTTMSQSNITVPADPRAAAVASGVRVDALRWVGGAYFIILGVTLLLLPQTALGSLLGFAWLRGALSIFSGLCLFWLASSALPPRTARWLHVAAALPQFWIAFEFLRLGSLQSASILFCLAVAMLFAARVRSATANTGPQIDLLGIVLGMSQAGLGLEWMVNPSLAVVLANSGIPPFVAGAAALASGLLVAAAQFMPRAPGWTRWAMHLCGGLVMLLLWAGLVSYDVSYALLYSAMLLRGLATVLLPWLGPRLAHIDSHSLRLRLALALSTVALLPPLAGFTILLAALDPTNIALASVRQLVFALTLFGALAAGVAGWWLAGQLAQPVAAAVHGVRRIADGQRGSVAFTPALSEFAGLAVAVQQMADALEARERERESLLAHEHTARASAERAAERVMRLQQVTVRLLAPLTTAQVAEVVLSEAKEALGASILSVRRLSDDGERLESAGLLGNLSALNAAYWQLSLATRMPVTDAIRCNAPIWLETQAAYLQQYPNIASEIMATGIQAACALPLLVNNRLWGGLAISFAQPHRFDTEEREFIQTLARQCALALDRARLYEVEQQARLTLETRVAERTHELQRLASHLQSAREEERTVLARDLHDDIAQLFTVFKMHIAQIAKRLARLESDPSAREQTIAELQQFQQALDMGIQTVRTIIESLRPQMLNDFGLGAAIEWQLAQFRERTGIETRLTSNVQALRLPAEHELALFRIVQESLTNVARHAHATRVDVQLRDELNTLLLEIRDNGRGITSSELSKDGHFGVLGMRERALVLGADMQIGAAADGGTSVVVRLTR